MRQDWLLAAPEFRVQSAECRAQSAVRPFLFLAVKRRGVLLDICDADALMPSPHLRLLDRETPQPRRVGAVARRRHARLVAVAHVELKVGEAGRAVPLKVEARALVLVAHRNTHPSSASKRRSRSQRAHQRASKGAWARGGNRIESCRRQADNYIRKVQFHPFGCLPKNYAPWMAVWAYGYRTEFAGPRLLPTAQPKTDPFRYYELILRPFSGGRAEK